MPQIYSQTSPRPTRRIRSSSSASSSSSSSSSSSGTAMRPTNADDSIVLSDLVRSGEASRLRRRGAIRSSVVLNDRPDWGVQYDFDFADIPQQRDTSQYTSSGSLRSRRTTHRSGNTSEPMQGSDEYVYSLTCGAPIKDYDSCDSTTSQPFRPSILPLFPKDEQDEQQVEEKEQNRSTGCGSLIHKHSAPRPRVGVWSACTPAEDCVVQLEAEYFDTREAAKFTRSACGCVKEGIGCAVCGNPLGTRYIPCKSAADTFLCSRSLDKSLTHFGSSRRTATSKSGSERTVYTFFSTAVSSTLSYTFPAPQPDVLSPSHLRRGLDSSLPDSHLFNSYVGMLSSSFSGGQDYFSEDDDEGLHTHGLEDEEDDDDELGAFGVRTYDDDGDPWYPYSRPIVFSSNVDEGHSEGPSSGMFLDRFATASPAPLSETDERPHSARAGQPTNVNLDAGSSIPRPSSSASASSSGSSATPTFAVTYPTQRDTRPRFMMNQASRDSSAFTSQGAATPSGSWAFNPSESSQQQQRYGWSRDPELEQLRRDIVQRTSQLRTRTGRGRSSAQEFGYDYVYNFDGPVIDENFGYPYPSFDPDGSGVEVWGTTMSYGETQEHTIGVGADADADEEDSAADKTNESVSGVISAFLGR